MICRERRNSQHIDKNQDGQFESRGQGGGSGRGRRHGCCVRGRAGGPGKAQGQQWWTSGRRPGLLEVLGTTSSQRGLRGCGGRPRCCRPGGRPERLHQVLRVLGDVQLEVRLPTRPALQPGRQQMRDPGGGQVRPR
ncbi:hypothetical protein HPB51_009080 [Rhipicephalus microplus]|uniref:Uncharacterized protein n=1 Tax=Rhipicephalus microplus TaxID=6941 RepID=A0A9J6F0S3_RHIMP|nr:hypothetical protein HPB51_009080 [Rhipicephalus microplus]